MSTVDLPNIREPFIDARTGQISRPWWIWLQQLMARIGGSQGTDISALTAAVTALIATTRAHDNEINGFVPLPPAQIDHADFPGIDVSQVGAIPFDYAAAAPVQSVFGRTGDVVAQSGDYTVGQVTNAASVLLTLAQFAATTSAQLAGVMSDETGSGELVFGTTPTLTRPNIVGTNTNDNAAAGSVGEYLTGSASATSLTSNVEANVAQVSLSAGDYDVSGTVRFIPAATTTVQALVAGVNTTSATFPPANTGGLLNLQATLTSGALQVVSTPERRISIASTTTAYLVARATFGVSTMTADGFIRARRVR